MPPNVFIQIPSVQMLLVIWHLPFLNWIRFDLDKSSLNITRLASIQSVSFGSYIIIIFESKLIGLLLSKRMNHPNVLIENWTEKFQHFRQQNEVKESLKSARLVGSIKCYVEDCLFDTWEPIFGQHK